MNSQSRNEGSLLEGRLRMTFFQFRQILLACSYQNLEMIEEAVLRIKEASWRSQVFGFRKHAFNAQALGHIDQGCGIYPKRQNNRERQRDAHQKSN